MISVLTLFSHQVSQYIFIHKILPVLNGLDLLHWHNWKVQKINLLPPKEDIEWKDTWIDRKMFFTHSWINRKCSSLYYSNSLMLKWLRASTQNISDGQKWRISDSVTQWLNRNMLVKVYVPWTSVLCRLNHQHMVNCSPSCRSSTLLPSCSTRAETGNAQRP